MNLTMNGYKIEFFWVMLGLGFASAKLFGKYSRVANNN